MDEEAARRRHRRDQRIVEAAFGKPPPPHIRAGSLSTFVYIQKLPAAEVTMSKLIEFEIAPSLSKKYGLVSIHKLMESDVGRVYNVIVDERLTRKLPEFTKGLGLVSTNELFPSLLFDDVFTISEARDYYREYPLNNFVPLVKFLIIEQRHVRQELLKKYPDRMRELWPHEFIMETPAEKRSRKRKGETFSHYNSNMNRVKRRSIQS